MSQQNGTKPRFFERLGAMALPEFGGWVGMCLIHGSTIPVTVSTIMGWNESLPPLSMILLIWTGLALFLWCAVYQRNTLYIVSNAIGFALNSILLSLIVFS